MDGSGSIGREQSDIEILETAETTETANKSIEGEEKVSETDDIDQGKLLIPLLLVFWFACLLA